MNAYTEMKARHQAETNALPLGFAFGDKQFDEMMRGWGLDPEKDLDKICRLGHVGGGFLRKADVPLVCETMARHDQELKNAIAADKTGRGFIFKMFYAELQNHEYAYTGDLSETVAALGFSEEDILSDKRLNHGLALAAKKVRKDAE